MSELQTRLQYLKRGEFLLPLPQSSSLPGKSQQRSTSGSGLSGLRVTVRTSRDDGCACLGRREGQVEWKLSTCREPSRMYYWFLGLVCTGSQCPTPVPFIPFFHTTRSEWHLLLPETVEQLVAIQLCLGNAATWWGNLCLPSQACKYSPSLSVLTQPVRKPPLPGTLWRCFRSNKPKPV